MNGPHILSSSKASGERFVGAINHGHTLRFKNVNFDQISTATLKIASAGAGGAIELRADTADGALLVSIEVEVNGNWEEFYERAVELNKTVHSSGNSESIEITGHHDMIVVFTDFVWYSARLRFPPATFHSSYQ